MSLLANSNAIETGGYNLQRSLRFRSSASANLTRTPSSTGNRKTWTWSGWVKRGKLGAQQNIFGAGASSGVSPYETALYFNSSDTLGVDINGNAAIGGRCTTNAVFRDPSAWYHIVCYVDMASSGQSNKARLYVNGVLQTVNYSNFGTTDDSSVNNTVIHKIAADSYASSSYFDGYLAEVNFIDGQALSPSSFGQTDAVTGVWTPKKYTGTYGTNGFYLPFTDNTSATTLAYDKSGNGNNWTANNISTTAGTTYDSMTDVPTLTSATAANYCVLNPLDKNANIAPSDGNLLLLIGVIAAYSARSTIGMSAGKWYCEVTITAIGSGAASIGLMTQSATLASYVGGDANGFGYLNSGVKITSGSSTAYGLGYTLNDVIGVAFDADVGTLTFYRNGSSQGVAFTGLTSGPYFFSVGNGITTYAANFGQRPFSYTPPTGFVALNTFNLPDPTIKKPNQYMDATLYTGTGASQSITNSASMQPSLVWIKSRNAATNNRLYDAVRGATLYLESNATTAETTNANGLTAFNANGFTVGSASTENANAGSFIGWQWKESATAGFDIVTFTSDGSSLQTINHSLGVSPAMIIVKTRSTTGNWSTYQKNLTSTNYYLNLNTTAAEANLGAQAWGVSSSSFQINSVNLVGGNGTTAVAYLFAEIPGFSKFGSYTGNGSADGPFVFTNFQPKYVMIKRTDSTGNWYVWDTVRNTYNVVTNELYPNLSNAEASNADLDANSNGFKIRNTTADFNANGGTFIYAAFSTFPFKYSTAR